MSARKVLRYTLVVRNPETLEAVALVAGSPVPAWAKELVHADDLESPGTDDEETGEEDSSTEGPKAIADMNVKELKAEIDSRNEGRDDESKIAKTGDKAALLAALEADDKAQAESDDTSGDGSGDA